MPGDRNEECVCESLATKSRGRLVNKPAHEGGYSHLMREASEVATSLGCIKWNLRIKDTL